MLSAISSGSELVREVGRKTSPELFVKGLRRSPDYMEEIADKGFRKGFNKMLNDYEKAIRPPRCRSYPQLLNIAVTDMCNLGCLHCPRTHGEIDLNEMKVDDLKRIIDQVSPYTSQVQVSAGIGEPLMFDGLLEVVSHAREKNMDVYMMTNATLLDEYIEDIFELGLSRLSVSMEGASKETYERIRVGADYDNVLGNVKQLCDERERRNSATPHVKIAGVVFPEDNLDELTDFIYLADDIGVDSLGFNDLIEPLDVEGISGESLQSTSVTQEEIDEQFRRAREAAAELEIDLKLPGDEQHCDEPWKMLTVNTKGKVRPCCTGPYHLEIHDILEEDFEDIWNSDQFVQWRRQMMSDDPQQTCVDCQKPLH